MQTTIFIIITLLAILAVPTTRDYLQDLYEFLTSTRTVREANKGTKEIKKIKAKIKEAKKANKKESKAKATIKANKKETKRLNKLLKEIK